MRKEWKKRKFVIRGPFWNIYRELLLLYCGVPFVYVVLTKEWTVNAKVNYFRCRRRRSKCERTWMKSSLMKTVQSSLGNTKALLIAFSFGLFRDSMKSIIQCRSINTIEILRGPSRNTNASNLNIYVRNGEFINLFSISQYIRTKISDLFQADFLSCFV